MQLMCDTAEPFLCDIRLDHYHGVGDDSECESDFSLDKKGTQKWVLKDFP